MDDQHAFSAAQGFPFILISDSDRTIGEAYHAVRTPGMKYYEAGIPRRITYLIAPDGTIAATYDLEASGADLSAHAQQVLDDIALS